MRVVAVSESPDGLLLARVVAPMHRTWANELISSFFGRCAQALGMEYCLLGAFEILESQEVREHCSNLSVLTQPPRVLRINPC